MRLFRVAGYPGRTMGNDALDDLRELVVAGLGAARRQNRERWV
jgi:hypothetical protein